MSLFLFFPSTGKKGLVFAEASQPCPRGGVLCLLLTRLWPLPVAGIALPALPRFQLLMVAATTRAASRLAGPLPPSLPLQHCSRSFTATRAHTATPVCPSSGLSRLAAPLGGSSLPSAASRREQAAAGSGGSRERPAARPLRSSLPVALPVSDAPGSEAAGGRCCSRATFFLFVCFCMLEAEEDFNFSTGLIGILLAGEGRISAVSRSSLLGCCSLQLFPELACSFAQRAQFAQIRGGMSV